MMRAWLQRHIGGCTTGALTGAVQRMDFRMGLTGTLMKALGQPLAVLDQHATDTRIRHAGVAAMLSQAKRPRHPVGIMARG